MGSVMFGNGYLGISSVWVFGYSGMGTVFMYVYMVTWVFSYGYMGFGHSCIAT